jgi:RHS repeat-associated protein
VYYHARYYDPVLARFVSADSVVPGAGPLTVAPSDATALVAWATGGGGAANPQALNRYSYVNNNPLRYTDPTGHTVDDREKGGAGAGGGFNNGGGAGGCGCQGTSSSAGRPVSPPTRGGEYNVRVSADGTRVPVDPSKPSSAGTARVATSESQTLYRGMRTGADAAPETGPTARTLGARPNTDIPVNSDGTVQPGTGGMSVSPNSPSNLPPFRRPPEFG